MSDYIVSRTMWNMSGHELDLETHKIKENGKIFWGSYVIIQEPNELYNYSRIDTNQTEPKQFDTERKALNFVKKLVPNLTKRDHVVIYSRQKYDAYIANYEKEKSEEVMRNC